MIVLGISALFHDAAACLVIDGRVVAAAQEERFSRIKHDASLPVLAARFCLEQAGVTMADVDHVVFYEKPIKKLERIVVTQLREFPHGLGQFTHSMASWLGDRLWVKSQIAGRLGCASSRILFLEHHLSHAASAFLPTGFDDAAVVTVDGVGEWATTSIFRGHSEQGQPRLTPLRELCFPHSIGLFYSALTAYLGFDVNGGEYKVMGLAAYGQPTYLEALTSVCRTGPDASLEVDDRYFAWSRSTERGFTQRLETLLGPARRPGSPLCLDAARRQDRDPDAQRFADIAASTQRLLEEYLLALAFEAHRLVPSPRLCLAGGVALNSVANRVIAERGPFDEVYVHPAADDAGGALGAALYVSQVAGGDPRQPLTTSFLGADHSAESVRRALGDAQVRFTPEQDPDRLAEAVAARLARGQAGAISRGRFEWGPRALGARSILADPRTVAMRDRVNASVKRREAFRPFAPSVIEEHASRWFELGAGKDRALLRTMTSVLPAHERGRAAAPAVVHVDGTARVHTVPQDATGGEDRFLRSVLEHFVDHTGLGVLLHTSLNLKDEPMCASAADAWATFARSDLDFLVLGDCLVDRRPS